MDYKEIQNFIRFVKKSGVAEVELSTEEFEIRIVTENPAPVAPVTQAPVAVSATPQPVAPTAQTPPAQTAGETTNEENSNYVTIKSPMIGTFYRKPGPDKDVFVNVGDTVNEGDVVCIIEAMKLFNEIESEVSGKIVKVLVDDSSPVEYDQPLFLVDPS